MFCIRDISIKSFGVYLSNNKFNWCRIYGMFCMTLMQKADVKSKVVNKETAVKNVYENFLWGEK